MKKKIVAMCLVVALAVVAIGGATLAYFTDSEDQTNTFTTGNVGITLDEAVVVKNTDGDLVAKYEDNKAVRTENDQTYKLYPGMTVTKDPTITVSSGSEDSYIAAKITIKGDDLWDLYGVWTEGQGEKYWNIDINKFVSGGLIKNGSEQKWNWNGLSMVYEDSAGNVYYQDAKEGEWVIYVFLDKVYKAEDSIVLFDTITVDDAYGNTEMAKLNNATVKVEAFAVQEYGFDSCFEAMTTAFSTQFPFATAE